MHFAKHSPFLVLAAFMLATQALAGFGNEAFDEDPSVSQKPDLDWPEVTFPSNEERGVGLRPGELFEYRAQWGFFRKAGKITIETQEVDGKLQVVTTTASAGLIRRFYPMTLTATATIDTAQHRLDHEVVNGKTRSDVTDSLTTIDYESMQLSFINKVNSKKNKTPALPYDFPLDHAGSLLQLRGYNLEVGGAYPMLLTSKGKFYYVEMTVARIEELNTKLGDRDCFRLEPTKAFPQSKLFREGGKFTIWITNDDQRLPIRFDVKTSVGTASVRLETYETGL